jgi:hypothetical protein
MKTYGRVDVQTQLHAPAALIPEKEPQVPFGVEARWPTGPVWMKWRGGSSLPYRNSTDSCAGKILSI